MMMDALLRAWMWATWLVWEMESFTVYLVVALFATAFALDRWRRFRQRKASQPQYFNNVANR